MQPQPPQDPPQYPYPGPPPAPKPGMKTWQVLTAIGIGSFLGVVLVCGGSIAITTAYFQQQFTAFNQAMSGNIGIPNLTYTMQAPPDVIEGQPFEIQLTLENTGPSPMTLYSLDDYSGLTLIRSDPPWQSMSGGEMIYQLTLPPNQLQTIKITASSNMLGSQQINIDAHADSAMMNWAEAYAIINVKPPPAQPSTSVTDDPPQPLP